MCTFRGPLLLQKMHATDILNGKREDKKRKSPTMQDSYVHMMLKLNKSCAVEGRLTDFHVSSVHL